VRTYGGGAVAALPGDGLPVARLRSVAAAGHAAAVLGQQLQAGAHGAVPAAGPPAAQTAGLARRAGGPPAGRVRLLGNNERVRRLRGVPA